MKKKLIVILAIVIMCAMILAACGAGAAKSGTAKISGVYLTKGVADYSNMRPNYNFYLYNWTQSELTLYEDGTYMVVVSDMTFSGVVLAEDTNDHSENDRNNSITKLFGTYTAAVDELDEDLLNVTLSAPTRVIRKMDEQQWLDTDNWTDAMGLATAHKEVDGQTGETLSQGEPLTAEQYLAEAAFTGEYKVVVNNKTFIIEEFTSFGVKVGFSL